MGLIVTGGSLINGLSDEPKRIQRLLIEKGRIVEIVYADGQQTARSPEHAHYEILDAEGKFICPGLINAHLHLYLNSGRSPFRDLNDEDSSISLLKALVRCRQILRGGITTVRDLGAKDCGVVSLREAINTDLVEGPRLMVCGQAVAMTGGHALAIATTTDGTEEMRKTVRERLSKKVDFIKVFATGGFGKENEALEAYELDLREIRTAVEVAHASGKKVAAHAYGNAGIRNAIQAGVDSIEHGTFLDEETISQALERGIFVVPTLSNTYQVITVGEREGLPKDMVETAKRIFPIMMKSFEVAYRSGVKLAAGTDGGSWFNPHHDLVTELVLRGQAGARNSDLIRMATRNAAECLGLESETGTIEKGKRSDLIVLNGNPLQNIRSLANPSMVIKGERVLDLSQRI